MVVTGWFDLRERHGQAMKQKLGFILLGFWMIVWFCVSPNPKGLQVGIIHMDPAFREPVWEIKSV